MKSFVTLALLFISNVVFADWPQGAGSSGGFLTSEMAASRVVELIDAWWVEE